MIRGDQRSSEVIRGHQRSSEVIRGHQRSSAVIRGHQRSSAVISGHQRSSEVISGHQRSSEAHRILLPKRRKFFCRTEGVERRFGRTIGGRGAQDDGARVRRLARRVELLAGLVSLRCYILIRERRSNQFVIRERRSHHFVIRVRRGHQFVMKWR